MFAASRTDSTLNRVSLLERLSRICSPVKSSGSASVNQLPRRFAFDEIERDRLVPANIQICEDAAVYAGPGTP